MHLGRARVRPGAVQARHFAQNFDYSAARQTALFKTLTIEYVFRAFRPETGEKLLYTWKYEREVTLYLKFCTKKVRCLPKVEILSIWGPELTDQSPELAQI